MSVSSLNKFTVPLDNDQSANGQNLLFPKLSYSFRVSFENFGISTPRTELTKQVKTFTRPKVDFEPVTVDVYNSKVHFAGKHTWQDVTVSIRDDMNGNVTRLIGEQLQKQFDMMEQSRASSGIDYKFITRYETLDGGNGQFEPTVLETWEMYGCFITNASYSDGDYASSEPMTIDLTLRYDNAVQTPLGTGVGVDIGRTLGSVFTG